MLLLKCYVITATNVIKILKSALLQLASDYCSLKIRYLVSFLKLLVAKVVTDIHCWLVELSNLHGDWDLFYKSAVSHTFIHTYFHLIQVHRNSYVYNNCTNWFFCLVDLFVSVLTKGNLLSHFSTLFCNLSRYTYIYIVLLNIYISTEWSWAFHQFIHNFKPNRKLNLHITDLVGILQLLYIGLL